MRIVQDSQSSSIDLDINKYTRAIIKSLRKGEDTFTQVEVSEWIKALIVEYERKRESRTLKLIKELSEIAYEHYTERRERV